ncbi:hypothetical protein MTR67_014193 [Solanum verrucosum]|uniref:Uncharacterized protein n=1 Tax=Solanum verrucosum TaxID=315347 RepID=A0AAF0QDZ7_SOLVR|nr:hypothetical protein MTR67_014193 [Solanum verrucosum]
MSLPVQRRKFPDFESRICSRWRKSNNATSLKEVISGRLYSIHLVITENGSVDFDLNQSSYLLGYNLKELIFLKSLSIWSTSMPTNDVQQFSMVGSIKLFKNFGLECYGMLKYQQIYL